MPGKFEPPETCPVCGEEVPRNARACPECGADERSGWKEDAAIYDGLDLPDEDFDADRSTSDKQAGQKFAGALQLFWWVIAVVVLLAFVLLSVR